MVHYAESDVIPISQFPYAWRLTDERWDRLPEVDLAQIVPLGQPRGAELNLLGRGYRRPLGLPAVNTNRYHVVSDCSLPATGAGFAAGRAWLETLPVSNVELVYISWSNDAAVVTNWGMVKRWWDAFWYLDVLNIFDDSLQWGLLFGGEEHAVWVEAGGVADDAPKTPRSGR